MKSRMLLAAMFGLSSFGGSLVSDSFGKTSWRQRSNYWGGQERCERRNKLEMPHCIVQKMRELSGREKKNFIRNWKNGVSA